MGAVTPCAATLFGGTHGGDRDEDGANPGAAQAPPPDIPGCPICSRACPGWQDVLHPWPGRGRKVPGESEKGGPGTHHPWVMLRWEPVQAGTESRRVHVGRSQAPARGLTLKKKMVYLFQDLPFFFFLLFCCFYLYFKKSGAKVQKKSVAERQRFRNHSAERTQARNTEHEPNTPTTRPNYDWIFCFPLYKTHQSMPRSGKGHSGGRRRLWMRGGAWLPRRSRSRPRLSRQVVLEAIELPHVLLPFAAVVLGRRRVVDVERLLVLQAGFQRVLQLVGSAGIILRERRGSGPGRDGGETQ